MPLPRSQVDALLQSLLDSREEVGLGQDFSTALQSLGQAAIREGTFGLYSPDWVDEQERRASPKAALLGEIGGSLAGFGTSFIPVAGAVGRAARLGSLASKAPRLTGLLSGTKAGEEALRAASLPTRVALKGGAAATQFGAHGAIREAGEQLRTSGYDPGELGAARLASGTLGSAAFGAAFGGPAGALARRGKAIQRLGEGAGGAAFIGAERAAHDLPLTDFEGSAHLGTAALVPTLLPLAGRGVRGLREAVRDARDSGRPMSPETVAAIERLRELNEAQKGAAIDPESPARKFYDELGQMREGDRLREAERFAQEEDVGRLRGMEGEMRREGVERSSALEEAESRENAARQRAEALERAGLYEEAARAEQELRRSAEIHDALEKAMRTLEAEELRTVEQEGLIRPEGLTRREGQEPRFREAVTPEATPEPPKQEIAPPERPVPVEPVPEARPTEGPQRFGGERRLPEPEEVVNLEVRPGKYGQETTFFDPRFTDVEHRAVYDLVEARNLYTSHDENLQHRPFYPAKFQPRDLGEPKSASIIEKIGEHLDPRGVAGDARTSSEGPPVTVLSKLGEEQLVLAGNSRALGMMRSNPDLRAAYEQYVARFLSDQSGRAVPIEEVRGKILVRRLSEPTVEEAVQVAGRSNLSITGSLSPLGEAQTMAISVGYEPGAVPFKMIGKPISPENVTEFMAENSALYNFLKTNAGTERFSELTRDSREMSKMVSAMLTSDLPPSAKRLVELGNPELERLVIQAAPLMVEVREAIRKGDVRSTWDLEKPLEDAARVFLDLRGKRRTVDDVLKQVNTLEQTVDFFQTPAFPGGVSREGAVLSIGMMNALKNAQNPPRYFFERLVQVRDTAFEDNPRQQTLAGLTPPDPAATIVSAFKLREGIAENVKRLMPSGETAEDRGLPPTELPTETSPSPSPGDVLRSPDRPLSLPDNPIVTAKETSLRPELPPESELGPRPTEGRRVSSTDINPPAVIAQLEKATEAVGRLIRVRVGGMESGREALGEYQIGPRVIRMRKANDIPTATHEVAHALQDALIGYEGGGPWGKLVDKATRSELHKLGKMIYKDEKPAAGYESEGFALFMDMFVNRPAEARKYAPKMLKFLHEKLLPEHPDLRKPLLMAQDMVTRMGEASGAEYGKAMIVHPHSAAERAKRIKAAVSDTRSIVNKVATATYETAHPLYLMDKAIAEITGREPTTGKSAYKTQTATRGTSPGVMETMLWRNMVDSQGRNVGEALNKIRPMVAGKGEDIQAYLYAKHSIERLELHKGLLSEKPDDPRVRGITEEGARRLLAGEEDGITGMTENRSREIVSELGTPEFRVAAEKIYTWWNGVKQYSSGVAPEFGLVFKKFPYMEYVPLLREFLSGEVFEGGAAGSGGLQGSVPGKRAKRSGRRVKDVLESLVGLGDKYIRAAHRREVLDVLLKWRHVEGMGEIIAEVPRDRLPAKSVEVDALLKKVAREFGEEMEAAGRGDLVEAMKEGSGIESFLTFFAPMNIPKKGKAILPMPIDGKVRWFEVDPGVMTALTGMEYYRGEGRIGKAIDMTLGNLAALKRLGTTGINLAFNMVTNPQRDLQTWYVNSKAMGGSGRALLAWLGSVRSVVQNGIAEVTGKESLKPKDPYLEFWLNRGGQMAQPLGLDAPSTASAVRRLTQGNVMYHLDPRNIYESVRQLIQVLEAAPRIAEIKLVAKDMGLDLNVSAPTREQGNMIVTAGKQGSTDFTAGGWLSRVLNRIVPFHGAAIQGPRVTLRRMKEAPLKTTLKGIQSMTIPAIALWLLVKDEEWWKELDTRERSLYWHVPLPPNPKNPGEGQVVKIPRAFETGQMFAALPEALLDSWYNEDPEAAVEWAKTFVDTATPPILPPPVQLGVEQLANKDFFWDRPIVRRSMGAREEHEQFDQHTRTAAIVVADVLSSAGVEVSPVRIEHAVRTLTGGVGSDILGAFGRGPVGAEEKEGSGELAEIPVLGRLFIYGGQSPSYPKAVRRLYRSYDEAGKRQASLDTPETRGEEASRMILQDGVRAVALLSATRRGLKDKAGTLRLNREIAKTARLAIENAEQVEVPNPSDPSNAALERERRMKNRDRLTIERLIAERELEGGAATDLRQQFIGGYTETGIRKQMEYLVRRSRDRAMTPEEREEKTTESDARRDVKEYVYLMANSRGAEAREIAERYGGRNHVKLYRKAGLDPWRYSSHLMQERRKRRIEQARAGRR